MRAQMVEAIDGAIVHLQSMRRDPSRYVVQSIPRVRELLDIAEREAHETLEEARRDGCEQLLSPLEA